MASQPAPRICVVGSAMIDLIAYTPRLPRMGETLVGTAFKQGFGGKGSNQAVMAAKLGAAVTMVVRLGADDYGRATLENYRQQGISTHWVVEDLVHASGVAPITVGADGHNTVIIVPGANEALAADDVQAASAAIREAAAVICQCEVPDAPNIAAFQIARAHGVRTILNPAPARPLPPDLLALTDLLVPNETEAELLTGLPVSSDEEAAAAASALQRLGVPQVIITLGARGALVAAGAHVFQVPPVPVAAVDTTGAGDAFTGSLAYYLAAGVALPRAVALANAVAALSVTRLGTQVSFPGRGAVDAFLVERGL